MDRAFQHISRLPVLAALLISLFISGCATTKPAVPVESQPNEFSAYLFSAGSVLYYNGDFAQAEELYRLALRYDPNAKTIREALFNTLVNRVSNREIPPAYFAGYVDSLLAINEMDKYMLELAYNVFAKAGDNQKAKSLLDLYLKHYQTARAYTSLFYLEQQLYNKSRLKLLDKAFKLAGEDAAFLNSLGYLYLAFDSTKAERIWQHSRRYDTSNQSVLLLWNLYDKQNKPAKLHQLYNSLCLPAYKENLEEVLKQALVNSNFRSLVQVSDDILASNDPQFVLALLQACWYTNNSTLFEQSWARFQKLKKTHADQQLAYFFGALYFLKAGNRNTATDCVAHLDSKNTLDEFINVYRATALNGFTEKDSPPIERLKQDLHLIVNQATDEQIDSPVRRYLKAVIDSMQFDNAISIPDSVAFPCVEWFYDNNYRTYDTYVWLAQYYLRIKDDMHQRILLQEALDEYPEDSSLLNWLGYSYVLSSTNLEEAEVLIRRALQLSPDNAYYLDSLAWLFYLKGDSQQAIALMDIPSHLDKLPSEIAWHIGSIYQSLKDNDNAVKYLKLAIEINDDPDAVTKAKSQLETLQ